MTELVLVVSRTELYDLGRLSGMGKRDVDGNGDGDSILVCGMFSIEMVELVGSSLDLAAGPDDFVVDILLSKPSVDLTI